MYLARFLGVTLDTCTYQDTSGYMYPGLFIKIHQDIPRYKIKLMALMRLFRGTSWEGEEDNRRDGLRGDGGVGFRTGR